jgi:3-oxoacyl-[acyl-carrier-protein] synthase II
VTWDITGMGAVANLGSSPEEIFDRLCAGVDGRSELQVFDPGRYRMHHAYEIRDRQRRGVDEPFRATKWLVASVRQALADASLPADLADVPVLVGTTMREQRTVELWWRQEMPLAPSRLHFGPALREAFGCATSYTFANACAASLYALGLGADLLDAGAADAVVVAGTDSITESAFGMLDRVQDGTPDGLRPFDESHRGMVMGEGAVAVVLQRHDAGGRRSRTRLRAVAMNCDAHHATAPHREGILAAIREAHRRAAVGPEQVQLVMLHGTATPLNDATEATVLSECFGGCPSPPVMTAIKSMTGHTLGGAGLLSLVMAVQSLRSGRVPPIWGLRQPIAEARTLRLATECVVEPALRLAQVNSFGFGGINAVAIVEAVSRG